jgi:hypothetical protein
MKLIYGRRSVGQSVLVSGSHMEPVTKFLFSVWRLRFSWCGAPSLTRGQVCNLLYNCFWALPEQSLWGRSPAELIWDSPNLEGKVPVFTAPRNSYTPGTGFPLRRLLRLAVTTVEVFYLVSTRETMFKLTLKLNYDRRSIGQSVLVSGTQMGLATNFSFFLKFSLDSYRFVIL